MASVNCPPAETSVLSWPYFLSIERYTNRYSNRRGFENSIGSHWPWIIPVFRTFGIEILELPWRQYVSTNDPRASFHHLFLSSGFKCCGFILGEFIERGFSLFFPLFRTRARYVYLRPSKHRNEIFFWSSLKLTFI